MNHGSFDKASLVNSLLGAVGNNTAGAKKMAAKTQADSAERFQEILQRARPEVAAREAIKAKPINEPARRSEPPARATEAAKTPASDTRTKPANEHAHKSTVAARDTANTSKHELKHKEPSRSGEGNDDDENNINASSSKEEVASNTVVDSDANSLGSQEGDADSSSGEVTDNPLVGLLMVYSSTGSTGSINPTLGADATADADTLLNADSELPDGDLVIDTSTALNTDPLDIITEASVTTLPSTDTDTGIDLGAMAATAGLVVGSVDPKTLVGASLQTAGSQTPGLNTGSDMSGNTVAGISLDDFFPDQTTDDNSVAAGDAEGDAPDSLLASNPLNAKTAFSKLMDTSSLNTNATGTGEKLAQALDAVKATPAAASPAMDVLTRLSEAQSSPAARTFMVQTGVSVPVGQPQWSQAVGDKVLWLAAQNVSAAEIRLDPPDLGPMHVKVSVNQDQASVSFTSPHPIVRDALDQQLNRLREMFADQGLNLVNVDVSDKSFAQQEREKNEAGANAGAVIEDDDELQDIAVTSAINLRLVDHYA